MTPWVKRLIIANVLVYFVQQTAPPAYTNALVFVPSAVAHGQQPWTIITYMFLHAGLAHIFFNMFGLYIFGPRVESRLGGGRFLLLYGISGASGAVFSFIFAPNAEVIGASAGVFGVMLAFARYWPREQLYVWGIIPVQVRVLVLITTLMALWSGLQGSRGGVADFAHLGGFAGAWLYLIWIDRTQGVRRFRKEAIKSAATASVVNWRKVDPKAVHSVNRDEVNRILDKISASGIGSLTHDERVFLSNFVPPDDRLPPVS